MTIALLSLTLLPASALATTTATSSEPQPVSPVPVNTGAAPTRPPTLDERTQARITNLAANLSTRMDNTAARLNQISGRLETRIDIESSTGKDVTAARMHLSDAKSEIEIATNALLTIDSAVFSMVTSADSKTAWLPLRETYINISNNLHQAHESLRLSVESLSKSPVNATSTTATSTNP